MELMNSIKRAWIRHREYERVWAELAFSTDRQLADMGLARGDIADIASAALPRNNLAIPFRRHRHLDHDISVISDGASISWLAQLGLGELGRDAGGHCGAQLPRGADAQR